LGAFIVEDVECGCMATITKEFKCVFPGRADTGAGSILDSDGMNRIRILMIQDEEIVIASTGRARETSGLIGV
jgi:hypothetical protein